MSAEHGHEESETNQVDLECQGTETALPNEMNTTAMSAEHGHEESETNQLDLEGQRTQTAMPNGVNRANSAARPSEDARKQEAKTAIVVMFVICVIQTAGSGVFAYLQGLGSNPTTTTTTTTKGHRRYSQTNLILMCATYLFGLAIVGLHLCCPRFSYFGVVVNSFWLAAMGSFTLALVLLVVFYWGT